MHGSKKFLEVFKEGVKDIPATINKMWERGWVGCGPPASYTAKLKSMIAEFQSQTSNLSLDKLDVN